MRKFMIGLLIMVMTLTMSVGALAIGNEKTAAASETKFVMDGKEVTFDVAYTIENSNYIQLRSVAQMLSGTSSQFNVYWDDTLKQAVIETGTPYTGVKPVVVEKDEYKVGDVISMKKTEIVITDVFTTTTAGSSIAVPGTVFYGVSFTIIASEKPYSNVGLDVYSFLSGIVTTEGAKYNSFMYVDYTKINLNQKAVGTIYYIIDQNEQVATINVRDVYGNEKFVSVI